MNRIFWLILLTSSLKSISYIPCDDHTIYPMDTDRLQDLCETGQRELMGTNYIEAEKLLAEAEALAWSLRDFDTLSRLYFPLQETRRQRRQRCGEGIVRLDLWATGPHDRLTGRSVIEQFPFGQLLVAGWGTIEPALELRRLAPQIGIYVETFLGAVYPTSTGNVIAILPLAEQNLPDTQPRPLQELQQLLPRGAMLFQPSQLPRGGRKGTAQTYAEVMALWERLHAPFLAEADAETDPITKMEAYRRTIHVDYACELAHQKLAEVAKELTRAQCR